MLREFEKEDLATMQKWLEGHGERPAPIDLLPPTGIMIEGMALGFLYLTNSSAAWIENLVSNPEADATSVAQAISDIVDALTITAKGYGVRTIFVLTKKDSVSKWAEHLGFEQAPHNYTMLARRL